MTQPPDRLLENAVAEIGRDDDARAKLIAVLNEWERRHQARSDGVDLRETITGPVVDALHLHERSVTRKLASGLTFTMAYRSKIAREFVMGGEPLSHVWEPQTSRLLTLMAGKAKTFVFGGAYAGDQAIPVAHVMAKHGGTVHCFELNAPQLAALEQNARQNHLRNVVINATGLWDQAGFIELVGHDSHAWPRFVAQRSIDAFPVTTIEDYAKAARIDAVDAIMLDIEGGEEAALRGAIRFLDMEARHAPDIVFEIHRAYVDWSGGLSKTSVVKMLTDRGYHVFALRDYQAHVDMTGKALEMVKLDGAYLDGPPHGFNLFATKTPARLDEFGVTLREGVSPKLLRHRLSPLHQPG